MIDFFLPNYTILHTWTIFLDFYVCLGFIFFIESRIRDTFMSYGVMKMEIWYNIFGVCDAKHSQKKWLKIDFFRYRYVSIENKMN